MTIIPLPDERLDQVNESLTLLQKTNGLTYGTDAYLLAAYLRPMHRARAADFGCGTGIISLLAQAKEKFAHVTAIEIQESFAELTERNIRLNGLEERIRVLCADITRLRPDDVGGELDVIFSNPPYMRTDSGRRNEADEKYIARHEVHGSVADFCHAAGRLLKHGGLFYVVWRPDRLSELMAGLHAATLTPKRMTLVQADTETPPSMVLLECKKGAAPSMKVTPTLILYRDSAGITPRVMTEAAEKIYDTCQFGDDIWTK
ncbi:MAG: methyltransferase [Clostridia bacterium]|nr:methyltransferase [Clostridia bacterium]